MSEVTSTLTAVTQGGAVVLLVLAAIGLYKLARDVVPSVKEFLTSLVATQRDMLARLGTIETKVDHNTKSIDKLELSSADEGDKLRTEIQRARDDVLDALPSRPAPRSSSPARTPPTGIPAIARVQRGHAGG